MLQLNQIHEIPPALLELQDITQIQSILPQPTLLFVKGQIQKPLFVTVLLHANESTSFFAIQAILKKYQERPLPRSLIIFFGNMEATKHGVRRLDNQPDYNRVWPGGNCKDCAEAKVMQEVVDIVAKQQPFASIDIHNNTGKNPHYGCINKIENEFLHLAALFSRTVVFFETPKGVQSMAMSKYCPAITLECGKPDEPHGIQHATDYVDTILHLPSLSNKSVNEHDVSVYHTVARVIVPKDVKFDFKSEVKPNLAQQQNHDLCFIENFDHLNFSDIHSGHAFAQTNQTQKIPLQALNNDEQDVTYEFFSIRNEKVVLNKTVMPAMITLDKKIIRQDCLCYLMEPLSHL